MNKRYDACSVMTKNTKKPVNAPRRVTKKKPQAKAPVLSRSLKLYAWLQGPVVARLFMLSCLALLLTTTMLWAVLGAGLHHANADQLIDTYLFESSDTFAQALFPGAHTFLLKWPIFAIMALAGAGPNVFMGATIFMVLATVGGLVFLLHKIEKRPYVFGVLCLALASTLLLVPIQPYPGALLPADMAMTTTRNLEYLVFMLVLWYAASLPKLKSWPALGVGLALIVLIASDKLFGVLALGSCIFAAMWYGVVLRKRAEAVRSVGWLLLVIVSIGGATVLLMALNKFGVTGIPTGESASPFALISSVKQLALALLFGAGALLTNFGANPVHAVTVVRDLPGALAAELVRPSILAYAANFVVLLLSMYATIRLLLRHRRSAAELNGRNLQWLRLSVLLVGAALVAAAVYVLTDHYYPVDARYLTISVFAAAVAAATYFSARQVKIRTIGALALLLVLALPFGVGRAFTEFHQSETAMAPRLLATARVAETMESHGVKRLVGDYWDVTPVKGAMSPKASRAMAVAPVDNCITPRPALNSKAWFTMPKDTPTAYLAVRDGSAEAGPDATVHHQANTATYGGCSLEKIVGSYGVPSERVRVDDTVNANGLPDVLVLLYPNGTKTSEEAAAERKAAEKSLTPVRKNLTALPDMADCSSGVTMQVVAHQDDDILFMNPDVQMSIKSGRCMRTVYITAGNAGESVNYWAGREQGAKAAYAEMYGLENKWYDETQYINDRKVTVSYLRDMPKVSLVFLRLPDGNIHGQGFPGNGNASLHGLLSGSQPEIHAVDGSAGYNKSDLVQTLLAVMHADQPDEIRTLGSGDEGDGDHADHHDSGILTDEAAALYAASHTVLHYIGYPSNKSVVNLSDDTINLKQSIFLAYAKFDGAVCQTLFECQQTPTYGGYLMRQYLHLPTADPPVVAAADVVGDAAPAP